MLRHARARTLAQSALFARAFSAVFRIAKIILTSSLLILTEELLCASPHIYHAIIFGAGHFVNGAVVSPPAHLLKDGGLDTDEGVQRYLELIWPHIEGHVNKIVPQHSRLLRGMVLVARPDRPFLVSDKGTVKTKASLALYNDDIDRAYEALERGVDAENGHPVFPVSAPSSSCSSSSEEDPEVEEVAAVVGFVQHVVKDALGRKLGPEDDFFRNGMDSLIATKLRTALAAAVRRAGIETPVPRNVVYAHPTCTLLARYLRAFAGAKPEPVGAYAEAAVPASVAEPSPLAGVDEMIEKYTHGFRYHFGTLPLPEDGDVYAVTGTTGSLGAAYVAQLLAESSVKKVYLLNRGHATRSMTSRQEAAFADKGLDVDVLRAAVKAGRVEFVEIEVGKARLGLSDEIYSKVRHAVFHLCFCLWTHVLSPT